MTSLHHLTTATATALPCRTTDPELWFSRSSRDRSSAVALCQPCPIRTACAQYAIDHQDVSGVWGGTTAADRRSFRDGRPWRFDRQGRLRLVCGSEDAYRAHFGYREQPCAKCRRAHEAHVTADRLARLAVEHQLPDGGSSKGFWIHRSLGQPPCEECREANLAQQALNRQVRARRSLQEPRTPRRSSRSAEALNGQQTGVQRLALAG